jgi:aspartate/methionine/tyrosine aminotransferase
MSYPTLTNRLNRLGTEKAFAVSLDASTFAAKGNTIYPFHLGDLNFKTPQHIIEALEKSIKDGKTNYAPAGGIMPLKEVMAEHIGNMRGIKYAHQNVVIQPGGKPTIGKFLQVVMNEGDAVLYPNPGYPIYESQIEYFNGLALPYEYISTKNGFRINREQVQKYIEKNNPKIFIYNNYQNPLGAESDEEEMKWVAKIAIENNMWVLSDEAYFDIIYDGTGHSIVSIPGMQERTVILYTFSKKFAMTGWRLGASIGPESVMQMIEKLNTNDEACTTHFVQYAGIAAITGDQKPIQDMMNTLRNRRDFLVAELNSIPGVSVHLPNSTFYLFPEVTEVYNKMKVNSIEEFRKKTLEATGVSFCTREHFGKPLPTESKKFIRFAYSGIDIEKIKEGMAKLKKYWI